MVISIYWEDLNLMWQPLIQTILWKKRITSVHWLDEALHLHRFCLESEHTPISMACLIFMIKRHISREPHWFYCSEVCIGAPVPTKSSYIGHQSSRSQSHVHMSLGLMHRTSWPQQHRIESHKKAALQHLVFMTFAHGSVTINNIQEQICTKT